jgi:hypothetical protein
MTARIPRSAVKTKDGKTVIEMQKPRLAVGQRKNAEGKAAREAKSWKAKSKGKP